MTGWRLVSDVGGSNVRFARSPGHHALGERRAYPLKDFADFHDALAAFLAETGGAAGCEGAAIGVAGPIDGNRATLTNAPWTIETGTIEALLGGAPARLVNDLQAVALALPHLGAGDLSPVGDVPRPATQRSAMVALNVGTGFGAAAIMPNGQGWITNPGEPGHMSLGARSAAELDLIGWAHSVEDVLSGRGIPRLYRHVATRLAGTDGPDLTGAEVFAGASADKAAAETVRIVSGLLGRVAGDLVLASAAWGGVYLCGSVVQGWAMAGGAAAAPDFRSAFEDKGPMSERMRHVYSGILTREDVALVGLTHLPVAAAL